MNNSQLSQQSIASLQNKIGQNVSVQAWCWNSRGSGKIRFLQLRDGSGFVQAVAGLTDVDEETFEMLRHVKQESVLEIQGVVQKNERENPPIEILIQSAKLLSVTENFPLGHKSHGIEFLMEHRHLWLRAPKQQAILKVRHEIIRAIHDYFDDDGFFRVDAPLFTPNACEGTSTLFETPYFDRTAYLSQSGQLYMEAAAAAMGKVYCFGPAFRAENSNTRRHLTEFWMVEPEVAFLDLEGDMDLAEGLVRFILNRVLERCSTELKRLKRDPEILKKAAQPFTRISYEEAVRILKEKGVEFQFGDDFGAAEETVLSKEYDTPVFVHHYPAEIKPFYMKRDSKNEQFSLSVDMLAPEGYGEIVGGGQREEDLDILENALKKQGLERSVFEWYLDLRRYGSVPHSGFGLGIERTVAWVCGLEHVRETIPFARTPARLEP